MEELPFTLAVAAVSFVIGGLIGYLYGRISVEKERKSPDIYKHTVGTIVIVGWFLSVGADILIADYSSPFALHLIAGGVVGYFFNFKLSDVIKK